MLKEYRKSIAYIPLLVVFSAIFAGCSRFAPTTPQPPKRQIMEITLKTAARVSDNYNYYIAFETANPLSPEGPRPVLSGAERGKNWSYYIRLNNRVFSEKIIANTQSIDEEPMLFNFSSPRYYQASFSSDTIFVALYLDQIDPTDNPISFNFITSELPLTPTTDFIPAIDYLIQPRITFTPFTGINASDSLYPLSSSHQVTAQGYQGADIIHWYVDVYER
jgi:hypothetical protein